MRTVIEARVEGSRIRTSIRWGRPIAALVSQRYLDEGGRLPSGWGIAWWEPDKIAWAILPIPLNVVFGLVRKSYWALAHNKWSRTRRDIELETAYLKGIQDRGWRN